MKTGTQYSTFLAGDNGGLIQKETVVSTSVMTARPGTGTPYMDGKGQVLEVGVPREKILDSGVYLQSALVKQVLADIVGIHDVTDGVPDVGSFGSHFLH